MTRPTTLVEDKFALAPEDADARNISLLRTAMELLYATYIVSDDIAKDRGQAIQAIDRMSLALGGPRLIDEWESHS